MSRISALHWIYRAEPEFYTLKDPRHQFHKADFFWQISSVAELILKGGGGGGAEKEASIYSLPIGSEEALHGAFSRDKLKISIL
jgi:hypothetical protein